MSEHTLYHVGYRADGWTPATLLQVAGELNALVVDVRLVATSSNPDWKYSNLTKVLGKQYLHLRLLGNKNYHHGGKKNYDPLSPELGMQTLLHHMARGNVILLCACNHKRCHVYDVAHMARYRMAQRGDTCTLQTLEPPKTYQQSKLL